MLTGGPQVHERNIGKGIPIFRKLGGQGPIFPRNWGWGPQFHGIPVGANITEWSCKVKGKAPKPEPTYQSMQRTRRRSTHKCPALCVTRQWWECRWNKCKNQCSSQVQPHNWTIRTVIKVQDLCNFLTCFMHPCCRHVNHFTSMGCRLPLSQQLWYTHLKAWLMHLLWSL